MIPLSLAAAEEALRACLAAARGPVVLAHIDVGNCGLLNLLCGPRAAATHLERFAARLSRLAGPEAFAAPAWSDEFHLAFPASSPEAARERLQDIAADLATLRAPAPFDLLPLHASYGGVYSDKAAPVPELLQQAQLACREARRYGSNGVVLLDRKDRFFTRNQCEADLGGRLLQVLHDGGLDLHVQPIYAIEGGVAQRVAKVEVLLRGTPADGEPAPLDASAIAVAERFGFVRAIDEYVLGRSLRWMREHEDVFTRIERFSINLSGQTLADRGFHGRLLGLLEEAGVDPRRLCFEITETSLVGDLSAVRELAQALRTRGCTIALDDFGVGLCSFGYLRELPVDEIKIDGSFIRRMTTDPLARHIVEALKKVADATGKRTVAEFVDSQPALDLLHELGVPYVQGWLFSRAMPMDELPAYLARFAAAPLPASR